MANVTLNSGSVSLGLSFYELSVVIKGLNIGLTYMYSHSKDFSNCEEDDLRDVRASLVDFYVSLLYEDECPEYLHPEKFSRSDYEHDLAVDVTDLPF